MLGDRLLIPPGGGDHGGGHANFSDYHWCTKNATGDIYARYCTDNGTTGTTVCDEFFTNSEVRYIPGIPGMASGVIKGNYSKLKICFTALFTQNVGPNSHRTRMRNASKWDLLLSMGVFTQLASNIKGFVANLPANALQCPV